LRSPLTSARSSLKDEIYAAPAWPIGIAAMTISFGIGQTLGPIVVGAITDAMGSLSFALNVSAAMLALGAVLAAFQKKLVQGG
jgi:hypothetical protein